jgi:hypothetical protein
MALSPSLSNLSGDYGLSIAAVSMISNFAVILATDTCTTISSNVASITTMTGLEGAYETTAVLESAGITTASGGRVSLYHRQYLHLYLQQDLRLLIPMHLLFLLDFLSECGSHSSLHQPFSFL